MWLDRVVWQYCGWGSRYVHHPRESNSISAMGTTGNEQSQGLGAAQGNDQVMTMLGALETTQTMMASNLAQMTQILADLSDLSGGNRSQEPSSKEDIGTSSNTVSSPNMTSSSSITGNLGSDVPIYATSIPSNTWVAPYQSSTVFSQGFNQDKGLHKTHPESLFLVGLAVTRV